MNWIKTSERLPETKGEYLVWHSEELCPVIAEYYPDSKEFFHIDAEWNGYHVEASHWYAITPPQEESSARYSTVQEPEGAQEGVR